MKISIIIPVYNVAEHVGRCIDSVSLQTYPDLECIIVDDCSTDNSLEVIETKLAGYSGPIEFKIVRQETNGGTAAARNAGVDAATGEYLYFLDSDDLITSDGISLLAEPLKSEQLDLVIGDFADNIQAIYHCRLKVPSGTIHTNQEIFASYLSYEWSASACNKLIRLQFLNDNGISFSEELNRHEDELWSFEVACLAQNMGCVNSVIYIYCSRGDSKINTLDETRVQELAQIAQKAEAFVEEKELYGNIDICRFLMCWREGLGHKAWLYGKRLAYQAYREHVWRHSVLIHIQKRYPELKKPRHWHHVLPARIGFCYYMMCKYVSRKLSSSRK